MKISYVVRMMVAVGLAVMAVGGAQHTLQARQSADQALPARVDIDNFTFKTPTLTIPAGTEVVWTNQDDMPHVVASTKKLFTSPPLDTGDTFKFTFKEPGTYEYFCAIHPHMTGKIVVTKASGRSY